MDRKLLKCAYITIAVVSACTPSEEDSHPRTMKEIYTLEDVLVVGGQVEKGYWASFTPASEENIEQIERVIGAALPEDFREFYLKVGWNTEALPGLGATIYSPEDLIKGVSTPIYFVTGSRMPGKEWATAEEHEELWKSNGNANPNPDEFTDEVLDFHGVPLWSLLQIGHDGIGSALCVYTGTDDNPPFRFCAIHQSELYYKANSYFEGLIKHLRSDLGEDPEE